MKLDSTFVGLAILAATFMGCGPAKPDPVATALAKRKAGAYVRVVNLSGKPAVVQINGQQFGNQVDDNATHGLKLVAPKATDISFNSLKSKLDAQAGVVHSVVFLPGSSSPVIVTGEERKSELGSSIQVLNLSGSPVKAKALFETNETNDKSAGPAFKEMSGKVTVELSSSAGKIQHIVECEDKSCYSIAVFVRNGKLKAVTLLNSVKMQFDMGGASPTG